MLSLKISFITLPVFQIKGHKVIFHFGLLLLLYACSQQLWARESDVQVIQQLQNLLSPMQSLTGKFKQTLLNDKGEVIQNSHGKFSVKRPGKFLWHTAEPFEQLLISNQNKVWLYDPDLEQVTERPYDQRLQQSPALLLSGSTQELEKLFDVELIQANTTSPLSQEPSPKQPLQSFSLTPRGEDKLFENLSLDFAKGKLVRMELNDSLGQKTVFMLSELILNSEIDESLFQFKPPPGTDIFVDE